MLRPRHLLILPLLAFITLDAEAGERPNLDVWRSARPLASAPTTAPAALGAVVSARDPARGVPSMVLIPASAPTNAAPPASPLAAARRHLAAARGLYKAGPSAILGARHRFTHDTGRGPTIVVLRQMVAGVEVFHGDVKVLLDRARRVRAIVGSPHPAAHAGSARPFALDPDAAIGVALRDLYPALGDAPQLRPSGAAAGGWQRFELADAGALRFRRPARAKRVYFPVGEALEPAYFLEVQAALGGPDAEVYQYVIAADDGRVLYRRDATAYEAFEYRVWADAGGDHRPMDGPMIDYTPHPTGVPGEGPKDFTTPSLISIDGFNASADPWLPPGATETLGNNVDAYIDHSNPDGLSGAEFRGSVTAPGVFDWTYDVNAEPLADTTQSKASITQIFYTVNWMHDWWYDSGFDEAAGNAQADNYGRGGVAGDVLHAEAQDAALQGARNNANMSTPADGESPRMQMYLWSGPSEASLTVSPLDQVYAVGNAAFGPKNFDVSALITVLDDGQGTTTDGCEAAVNDLVGRIALVDRGTCSFETKAKNALAAGAVGVLIANNQGGNTPPNLGGDNNIPDPQVPTQGITKAAGDAIKAALQNDPQTGHMLRESGVERDGTIDSMIVAHEWGHYIHHRLVECGSKACGAESEGWGDFMALHMSLREGDDLDGVYASVTYASLDTTGYYGIRRVPYSVNQKKNALTFRHISNGEALPAEHPMKNNGIANSEVHNAGEVWTTMLWESYIALQKSYQGNKKFDDARRAMSDYVVAGMILAPSSPTYTEQRDAILAAIAASSPEDFQVVAAAFASRGAGTCAISPPKDSSDLIGVVEDFGVSPRGTITTAAISDSLVSCDDDGVVDVGELGEVAVGVLNAGAATLPAGATVEIIDPDPSLVLPDGPVVVLPEIPAQEEIVAAITVAVDDALISYQPIALTLRLTAPGGCEETIERLLPAVINGDVAPESSKIDDVEPPTTTWVTGGLDGEAIWSRIADVSGHRWHGDDVGRVSDTWLESPELKVAADEPLVIAFDHAYSFEFSDDTYWDGGVLELSLDGGANWQDISDYVDPGYPAPINSAANPLDQRPAFVGDNPSYPDMDPLVLDLGLGLAGQAVKLRFRIGTDAAAGGPGWDIDNVAVAGILNSPFASWVADQGICVADTDTDTDTGGTDTGGTDTGGTDSAGTDSAGTDSASTGSETSGPTTSGGSASTGGSTGGPTSGATSAGPGGDPTVGTSDSDSATGTAGEDPMVEDGCGCRAGDEEAPVGVLALALGVLGLGRRRRSRP